MHDPDGMPELNPDPQLMGSKAVCALLDIDRATLTRWVHEGHITFAFKGEAANGAFVFSRAVVEKFADDLRALDTAPPADVLPGMESAEYGGPDIIECLQGHRDCPEPDHFEPADVLPGLEVGR